MAKRDLMGRYRGSLMGALWPLIYPMGHLLLYTFVFNLVLKVRFGADPSTGNFALNLMTGLLAWSAFSEAIARSTTCILEVPNLVKRVVFPLEVLPLVVVLSSLSSSFVALPLVVLVSAIYLKAIYWTVVFVPLILFSQCLFTAGLSWLLSSLGVYIRDIRHIMSLALSVWMYMTPIVYPPTALPAEFKFLLYINPLAGIVSDYRRVILQGLPPDWVSYCSYTAIALVACLVGYRFFAKTKLSFADVM
jgi:lipopolysaccharide transport system permease protein